MRFPNQGTFWATIGLASLLGATWAMSEEADDAPGRRAPAAAVAAGTDEHGGAGEEANGAEPPVTVAVARDRARLMHALCNSTLEVMHDRYFHTNRSVVPARALEDVFAEMAQESGIEARWISVNTAAMSVPHEPRNDFEKRAAREIAAGRPAYERVEDGFYIRAGAVLLGEGCVGCHTGFFKEPPSTPRFAALVVRIPLAKTSQKP